MGAKNTLSAIHRRLKRLNKKSNKRKKARNNTQNYEALEIRRVLNAAPIGVNDVLFSTQINQILTIDEIEDGLLANDYDLDVELSGSDPLGGGGLGGGGFGGGHSGPLYAENYSTDLNGGLTAAGGTLVGNDDGTFTYTPPTNFEGFDFFTYQVSDNDLYSEETLVTISVGQSLTGQLNLAERIGDNYLHTGAFQTTQTLGLDQELNYRSDAIPTPVVAVETRLLDGAVTPDSISVETILDGYSSGVTTYDIDGTFDPAEAIRLVQSVDAATLPTGFYDWTMTVTLHFDGASDEVVQFEGQQAVTNRTNSEFGNGWWLTGYDQLHSQSNGVLLENSDGSTYFFTDDGAGGYEHAVGDPSFSTLTYTAGTYTLTDKYGDSRTFDSSGRILTRQRLNSIDPDFTYSYVSGRLDQVADLSGRVTSFDYDTNGHLEAVVDIASRTTSVVVSSTGRLTAVTVADEAADPANYPGYVAPEWEFGYLQVDSDHVYLNLITDPANVNIAIEYDTATNRLSKMVYADGAEWQLFPALTQGHAGPGQANLVQVSDVDPRYIDEVGEIFRFTTNGFGNTTTFVDAEGGVSAYSYDQNGQLIRESAPDPDGIGSEYESSVTRQGYSENGNLVLVVHADDTTQEFQYHTTLNRVTRSTNELGHSENFYYETDGDLDRYQDAEFNDFYYEYDDYGNLIEERSENLSGPLPALITKYIYDPVVFDRLNEIQVNAGSSQTFVTTQSFTYTASDQLATVQEVIDDGHTRTTTNIYDPLDRVVTTILPDPDDIGVTNGPLTSPVSTYSYHANLQIESEIDPLGNETTYTYDTQRNFLTSITQPDPDGAGQLSSPVTTYEYYDNGLVHKEYRPEFTGNTHIEYVYDGNEQVTFVHGPIDGQVTENAYDDVGRLEAVTDVSGRTITYKYDLRNRLTQVVDHDPDGAGPLTGPTTSTEYDAAGQVVRKVDPIGRFTSYSYYKNGLLHKSAIQNPNPEAEGGLFGGGGAFDGGGGQSFEGLQATTYEYDQLKRLVATLDPSNRETTNVYNERGFIIEVISPDPDPDDGTTEEPTTYYTHDNLGRVVTETDFLGRITAYEYDNLDRITKVTLPDPDDYLDGNDGPLESPILTYEYDAVGNLTKSFDSLNRQYTTIYDNLYRPTQTTERTNSSSGGTRGTRSLFKPAHIATWNYVYNDQLQLAEIIDPEGASTEGFYDEAARLTTILDPLDNATTYEYDLLNRVEIVNAPDPDGAGIQEALVSTYGYDIYSRVITATTVNGTTTQQYNDAGELISLTDELGNRTQFAYDLLSRLTLETDALGNTTSNTYNIHGRLVRQADRNGNVIWHGQQRYTSTERWFNNPDGTPEINVSTNLDGGGGINETQTVIITNAPDGAFRLAFAGEVTEFLDIGASTIDVKEKLEALHAIDTVNVSSVADGYQITFTGLHADTDVDQLIGDVSRLSDGDPIRLLEFERDAVGNLLSITDTDLGADPGDDADDTFASANYVYTYDQLNRRISQNEVIAGLTPEIDLTTGYDIVGRRTSLSASVGGVNDYLNTYDYDYLDRPTWARQQANGGNAVAFKRIQYRYNEIGQLSFVNRFVEETTVSGTASLRSVFEYDDANRLETLTHKSALAFQSVTDLHQYDYAYDDAGRVESIDSSIDGLTLFSFTTNNQLVGADHDFNSSAFGNNPDESYQYDANGNRIGGSYVVDAQNRTQTDGIYSYEYDNEGNRTKRTRLSDGRYEVNTFDHRNRLVQVDFFDIADQPIQTINYRYDAFNNLVHRSVDQGSDGTAELDQFFAGFDGDQATLEFEGSDADDLTDRRLWGPFVDQLIASEEVDSLTSEGEVLWPITDHTGTIRDIAKYDDTVGDFEIASHRIYNSFGQQTDEFDPVTNTASNVELDYGFTGKFTDVETGLTHHQFRWFDPQLGKWISEDPLGFSAGDVNTTRYVSNAPLTYSDPTGLFAEGFGDGNGDSGQGGGDNQDDDRQSEGGGTRNPLPPLNQQPSGNRPRPPYEQPPGNRPDDGAPWAPTDGLATGTGAGGYVNNNRYIQNRYPNTLVGVISEFQVEINGIVGDHIRDFEGSCCAPPLRNPPSRPIGSGRGNRPTWSDYGDENEGWLNDAVLGLGNVSFIVRDIEFDHTDGPDGPIFSWTAVLELRDGLGMDNRSGRFTGPVEQIFFPPRTVTRGRWVISGGGG